MLTKYIQSCFFSLSKRPENCDCFLMHVFIAEITYVFDLT